MAATMDTGLRRRLRRYAVVLGCMLLVKIGCFAVFAPRGSDIVHDRDREDVIERRDHLLAQLFDAGPPTSPVLDDQFAGEWRIVTLSMTALATAQIAFAHPSTRADAVRATGRLAAVALRPDSRAFDTDQWRSDALAALDGDEDHIGYLAHLALVLGAHRVIGGTEHAALHHAIIDALVRRLQRAPRPLLFTYPGETYAMDNVALQAALGIAAVIEPAPAIDAERTRFVDYARAHLLDPETGVMGFSVTHDGASPSRGSGAGWNSFYLPHVDVGFATEQWRAVERAFVVRVPPLFAAVREHRHGKDGPGDVDSGPVILGLSPAGTGFAVAGARHSGDADLGSGLLATAELVGTSLSWQGRRRYVLAPDVGDAILLAMRTARRFDQRFAPHREGAQATPRGSDREGIETGSRPGAPGGRHGE